MSFNAIKIYKSTTYDNLDDFLIIFRGEVIIVLYVLHIKFLSSPNLINYFCTYMWIVSAQTFWRVGGDAYTHKSWVVQVSYILCDNISYRNNSQIVFLKVIIFNHPSVPPFKEVFYMLGLYNFKTVPSAISIAIQI